MVEYDSRWRVDDGRRIDVWRDHLALEFPSDLMQFVENYKPTPLKVCKLIDDSGR